jgi:membrane protein YqaA with SNARE-associated domain
MIRRLYDWTMDAATHDRAPVALFWVAFIESSVFPIPPDVMLIPMVLAQRAKAWWFATIATLGSVTGGIVGYAIGYFVFETVGEPILAFYGLTDAFHQFAERYNEWGAWIVFIAGVTPFPYKVITIASGATQLNLAVFMVASVLARGLRFFLVAGLLYWIGQPIRAFIERRLGLVTTVFVVLLVGGFIAIKYLL